MPTINLHERDLTTAGGLNASSNVVYVPGFAKTAKSKYRDPKSKYYIDFTKPYLFNNVSEFLEVFSNDGGKFEYIKMGTVKENDIELINVDKSAVYALALLSVGLPVLYSCFSFIEGNAVTENDLMKKLTDGNSGLAKHLELIKDKNNYDIKFITTGGYNTLDLNIATTMCNVAETRGDCTALIDHKETDDIINTILTNAPKNKFGAMFTPWCNFQFPSYQTFSSSKATLNSINMPGSLAYLLAFGTSVANGNANWLAAAGASRGYIPYLNKPLKYLTESEISSCQTKTGVSINPIAKINPYGVIIWGNRTLNNNTSGLIASSFLNIRQLCNDIKKTLYVACKSITFEQNSDLLWVKFKSMITPLLDQMQTGDGISGYQLTKKKSLGKATLTAVIRIYPIEAVEDFEITLELADEFTNVTDNL